MTFMKFNQFVDFNIADAVAVCHQKGLVAHIFLNALYSAAGHGVVARVDDGHFPRLEIAVMNGHFVFAVTEVKAYVRVV